MNSCRGEGYTCSTKTDHSNHVRLVANELTRAILEGATIHRVDDHKVGKVYHAHGTDTGSQAITDVGGFLGSGGKPVAVALTNLNFVHDENGDVHAVTSWKDRLNDMPEQRC